MATQEEIIQYIEKGLKQGFNIDYIKETLVNYGHNENRVNEAIKIVRDIKHSAPIEKHLEVLKKKTGGNKTYIGITIILLVIIGILGTITIKNKLSEAEIEDSLKEVDRLTTLIDENQNTIDRKIKDIEQMELTIEDKEELVEKQLDEINKLNEYIKEEREKTRDLLLELMAFILSK